MVCYLSLLPHGEWIFCFWFFRKSRSNDGEVSGPTKSLKLYSLRFETAALICNGRERLEHQQLRITKRTKILEHQHKAKEKTTDSRRKLFIGEAVVQVLMAS